MVISRRDFVEGLGAGALLVPAAAAARRLRPTPQETLGPYFPVRTPQPHDWDLAMVAGRTGRAAGPVIELSGRVLRTDGSPVPGAAIEIWQANAAGRYTNPVDKNPAPLDPNFVGVTSIRANAQGGNRIRTVKPGPYPDPTGALRAPHIHFDVADDDYRLVTQMYFPAEPLNANDMLMSTMAGRHRNPADVICQAVESGEPGVRAFHWDIVLLQV